MKLQPPSILLLVTGLFPPGADAGTVLLPVVVTNSGPLAPAAQFSSAWSTRVNLESGRAGLTAGDPILVTVRGSAPVAWTGSITYGTGDLSLVLSAALSLSIGELSGSTVVRFGGDYPGITEGSVPSGVFGYQTSAAVPQFSFAVPWGTDLSQAVFTFSQDSLLTGTAEGRFTRSSMIAAGNSDIIMPPQGPLMIELQNIPEPGPVILAGLAAGLHLLSARRRMAADFRPWTPDQGAVPPPSP